jgi:hypothetical protein
MSGCTLIADEFRWIFSYEMNIADATCVSSVAHATPMPHQRMMTFGMKLFPLDRLCRFFKKTGGKHDDRGDCRAGNTYSARNSI